MTVEEKTTISEKSNSKPSDKAASAPRTDSNSKKPPFRSFDKDKKPSSDRPPFNKDRKDFKRTPKEPSDFSEKVIWIRRINKVTTGGRRLRFSATVIVGNKKGTVGIGISKANEVSEAIKKAVADAHKNLKHIELTKEFSILHDVVGKYCSSQILLKPAKEGIGVKAGGAARDIMELAGIQNIYSKSLGSNNKINLARATIEGLSSLKTAQYFSTKTSSRKKAADTTVEEKK